MLLAVGLVFCVDLPDPLALARLKVLLSLQELLLFPRQLLRLDVEHLLHLRQLRDDLIIDLMALLHLLPLHYLLQQLVDSNLEALPAC